MILNSNNFFIGGFQGLPEKKSCTPKKACAFKRTGIKKSSTLGFLMAKEGSNRKNFAYPD